MAPPSQPAAYPYITLATPNAFTNLLEIFDEGLARGGDGPFLGHRPVLSKSPLKHAPYHVWQSWPAVDARRRALGSGVHALFERGVLKGGDLPTVGIWSKNCPSECARWFLSLALLRVFARGAVGWVCGCVADGEGLQIGRS